MEHSCALYFMEVRLTQNQIRSAIYFLTLTIILANCSKEPVFSSRAALNTGISQNSGNSSSSNSGPGSTTLQPGVQRSQSEVVSSAVNLLVCLEGDDCNEAPVETPNGMACPSNKVLVCKIPPGNPSGQRERCYPTPAVSAHIASGSHLGMCL